MREIYFYTDIDHTLTDENGSIPGEIWKTFLASLIGLSSLRFNFGVATGRGFLRALQVLDSSLNPNLPIIVLNGAEVYSHEQQNKPIFSFPLGKELRGEITPVLNRFYKEVKLAAFYPIGERQAFIYAEDSVMEQIRKNPNLRRVLKKGTYNMGDFIEWLKQNETGMVEISLNQPHLQLSDEFNQGLNISFDNTWLITREGVNKGTTVRRVCDELNISSENLIVAGDSQTDIPMFRLPEVTSIQVGNKDLGVITTYRVDSPSGLAYLLKSLCFK